MSQTPKNYPKTDQIKFLINNIYKVEMDITEIPLNKNTLYFYTKPNFNSYHTTNRSLIGCERGKGVKQAMNVMV